MKISYIGKCLLLEEAGERVLVLGDLHLGYEGAMRSSGVMVPVKLYEKCVADFDEIINSVEGIFVDKIIILGDLKHEFGFILQDEWNKIVNFLEYLKKKCNEIVVIEGNHDNILFPILEKLKVAGVRDYLWRDILFAHGDKEFPELYSDKIKYWVLGHGHPALNLRDGITRESYKCFLNGSFRGKKIILVPSFFPLVAGTDAREFDLGFPFEFNLENFEVFIVGDKLEVLKFGKLGKII